MWRASDVTLWATRAQQETSQAVAVSEARLRAVLLVDDDAMLRDLGRRMLEKLGEVVYVVGSGHEALEFLARRGHEVSLVITDLTMPNMTGLELIDLLVERSPTLPIAAICGYVVDPDARAQLDSRGAAFLPKPFAVPDLSRVIATMRRTTADL
jgi:CheY-like chemotaxis protein